MPILLYCVTLTDSPPVRPAAGVCEEEVQIAEFHALRLYFAQVRDPDTCLGSPEALKTAALQFHKVLREILAVTTPVPFRFPSMLTSAEAIEQHITESHELYEAALARVAGAVQYDIIGTWLEEQQADTATPVSGSEYLKRRQQSMTRVAAVEGKLKKVAGDVVREWRVRQDRKTHHWYALVLRSQCERFLAALRGAGPSEGVRLRLSGPWPPSEFIEGRGQLD